MLRRRASSGLIAIRGSRIFVLFVSFKSSSGIVITIDFQSIIWSKGKRRPSAIITGMTPALSNSRKRRLQRASPCGTNPKVVLKRMNKVVCEKYLTIDFPSVLLKRSFRWGLPQSNSKVILKKPRLRFFSRRSLGANKFVCRRRYTRAFKTVPIFVPLKQYIFSGLTNVKDVSDRRAGKAP